MDTFFENNFEDPNFVEPKLKYKRVPNQIKEIISKESISCISVHSKFMVIGTDWGNIHIVDHMGFPACNKMINAHSTVINQLSIDDNGEYVASCSDDGKVIVFGLLDDKQHLVISFNQEIKAVAIAPDFKKSFQFVTGDTRLILVSRGIVTNHKLKVLYEDRYKIRNIKWRGDHIVYATDNSVYVFDIKDQKLLGIIDPNKTHMVAGMKEFYCRIFWMDDDKFLIGWGHFIQLFAVKERVTGGTQLPSQLQRLPELKGTGTIKTIESVHSFSHPDRVLGIANFNQCIIVVVDPVSLNQQEPGLMENDLKTRYDSNQQKLTVLILDPVNTSPNGYEELNTDQIGIRGYVNSKDHRTHIEKLPGENEFFIALPKDLVHVCERNLDDRVRWLIENLHFTRAMRLLKETGPGHSHYSLKTVGLAYLKFLLDEVRDFKKAAELCKMIVDDAPTWENVIQSFMRKDAIEELLPYIPVSEEMRLSKTIYSEILEHSLKNLPVFLGILKMWPPCIYQITKTFNLILHDETNLKLFSCKNPEELSKQMQHREKLVLECIGILYEHSQEYKKAFEIYLRLKSPHVFDIILRRNLFEVLQEKLPFLIGHDRPRTLNLLMECIANVPPETVVKILQPTPVFLFYYLDELKSKNLPASEPYHSNLVQLYADFKKEKLLKFLETSDKYDLNSAFNLCHSRNLGQEQIYLLGRMGRSKEALKLIISRDRGVEKAIEYCQKRKDADLWEQLMEHSLERPEYVRAILETTTEEIDTKSFVKKVLSGQGGSSTKTSHVVGLKSSLARLLVNNEKRASLLASHQTARWRDLHHMLKLQLRSATAPIICELTSGQSEGCLVCGRANGAAELAVVACGHFWHTQCLPLQTRDDSQLKPLTCSICTNRA